MSSTQLEPSDPETDARLRGLEQALQRAQAVSHLVAGIVHDVRNSLQVVTAEAAFLAASLRDSAMAESAVSVQLAAANAVALLGDLLMLARGPDGHPATVGCAELLAGCERLVLVATRARCTCVFAYDVDAWSVAVDPHHLQAALVNLAANACDAMPDGGTLRISARNVPRAAGASAGDRVAIVVEDTGVGMPPAVLARATDAFFTTKGPGRGTGLGLAMVQAFTTRAGGGLRIDSAPGRGTRVELLLPRVLRPEARGALPAAGRELLDRITRRIRTPWLIEVLGAWGASWRGDGLPRPAEVEAAFAAHRDQSLVVRVDRAVTPPALHLLHLGDALLQELARSALAHHVVGEQLALGGLGTGYQRAAITGTPTYEHVRYALGDADGGPAELERLILPTASDGQTVSHLFGLVVLSPTPQPGGRDDPASRVHR